MMNLNSSNTKLRQILTSFLDICSNQEESKINATEKMLNIVEFKPMCSLSTYELQYYCLKLAVLS